MFVGIFVFMVILSTITKKTDEEQPLPTLREEYKEQVAKSKNLWIAWGVLAVLMTIIYVIFN